jgi:hypothetical protein
MPSDTFLKSCTESEEVFSRLDKFLYYNQGIKTLVEAVQEESQKRGISEEISKPFGELLSSIIQWEGRPSPSDALGRLDEILRMIPSTPSKI